MSSGVFGAFSKGNPWSLSPFLLAEAPTASLKDIYNLVPEDLLLKYN